MYIQRYMAHFPAAGEVIIFDRSWYNRAGVEHVMGFCSDQQYEAFLMNTPIAEHFILENGIILIKYWLEVSEEEQDRRFKARINDGRKILKLRTANTGPKQFQLLGDLVEVIEKGRGTAALSATEKPYT